MHTEKAVQVASAVHGRDHPVMESYWQAVAEAKQAVRSQSCHLCHTAITSPKRGAEVSQGGPQGCYALGLRVDVNGVHGAQSILKGVRRMVAGWG